MEYAAIQSDIVVNGRDCEAELRFLRLLHFGSVGDPVYYFRLMSEKLLSAQKVLMLQP